MAQGVTQTDDPLAPLASMYSAVERPEFRAHPVLCEQLTGGVLLW
jgi:hypothetical protein